MTQEELISSYNNMMASDPEIPLFLMIILSASFVYLVIGMFLVWIKQERFHKISRFVAVPSIILLVVSAVGTAGYMSYITENKEDIWKDKVLYGIYGQSLKEEEFKVTGYVMNEKEQNADVTIINSDNKEENIITTYGEIGSFEETYLKAKVIPVIKGVTSSPEYYEAKLVVSIFDVSSGALKQVNEKLSEEHE